MQGKSEAGGRLMTGEDLAALKARLGLPDHVLEYLRDQPLLSPLAELTSSLTCVVVMAACALLPVLAYKTYIAAGLLAAGFLPDRSILVKAPFSIPVFLLVAGPFLGAYLYGLIVRADHGNYFKRISSSLYLTVDKNQRRHNPLFPPLMARLIRRALKHLNRNLPAKEYLASFQRSRTVILGRIALVLYLIALLFIPQMIRGLSWVTPDSVKLPTNFGEAASDYVWRDAVSIETGCITSGIRTRSHRVRYRLRFADDRVADLGRYRPLRMSRLEALELIDSKLSALSVPKERGVLEQSCLNAKRRQLGPRDYERLVRILGAA